MLGCCVVVLALLGTVLSGFILGIDPSTRNVTSYDYVTDVTGLFDITDAPEYVTYSPSSNLVGYSPSSAINYTQSSTVNSYRYVVQDGIEDTTTSTVTYNSSYTSDTGRFNASEAGTSALINWNGTIDFGSTTTWQGVTYNASTAQESVQVGEYMGSMPMITSLSRVISALNLNSYNALDIELTYGTMPIMFYNGTWAFTNVERGDDLTQYIYSTTLNENNCMPTSMHVNLATNTVTAYRNDTQMWNINADQVDVIYKYSTRAGGSFSPATDASVTFDITAIGYPTYGYMDPTKGITIGSPTYTDSMSFVDDINADYDIATVLPNHGADTVYAYIQNPDGWNNTWSGSVTMNSESLQGVVRYVYGGGFKVQSVGVGILEALGIIGDGITPDYNKYVFYFDYGDYPIYMGPRAVENGENVFVGFNYLYNYYDDYSNSTLAMYYLDVTQCPQIDKMVYEDDTGTIYAYTLVDGVYQISWSSDRYDTWMIPNYFLLDNSQQSISPMASAYFANDAPIETDVTAIAEVDSTATWSNGYKNDEITISIQRESLVGNDLTITAGASSVTIATNSSGYMTATINGTVRNIGMWKNIQLTMSAVSGTLTLTPLTKISFTAPSNTNNSTVVIDGWYTGSPIETLTFSTSGQSLRWQVTQTTVFLDTYNAVMYNPSITITDYFPDVDEWRLNFYSFAIYGDSMTINNVPFTVDRSNGKVSFTLDDKEYTMPLQNIYITNQDVNGVEHLFLTFENNKTEFDLGATVSETISFTGLWYFTTGYYKAVTVTENYYDWQLDGLWHITSEQTIVVFLAILGAGLLVLKGMFGIKVGSIDGIVIIVASIIGIMMVI